MSTSAGVSQSWRRGCASSRARCRHRRTTPAVLRRATPCRRPPTAPVGTHLRILSAQPRLRGNLMMSQDRDRTTQTSSSRSCTSWVSRRPRQTAVPANRKDALGSTRKRPCPPRCQDWGTFPTSRAARLPTLRTLICSRSSRPRRRACSSSAPVSSSCPSCTRPATSRRS